MNDPGWLGDAAHAIGWTLVHATWTSFALWLSAAAFDRALPSARSRLRYASAGLHLLAIAVMPVAVTWLLWVYTYGPYDGSPASPGLAISAPAPVPSPTPSGLLPVDPSLSVTPAGVYALPTVPRRSIVTRAAEAIEPALPWAVAVWLVGVAGCGLLNLQGLLWIRRTVAASVPADDVAVSRFARIERALGMRRPVRYLVTELMESPATVGALKSLVLLPAASVAGLTPQQVDAVVVHELLHIRRHDYLINLLQAWLETLLFFHPAVWAVSALVRRRREERIDDAAMAALGHPRDYVGALVAAEKLRPAGRLASGFVGFDGGGSLVHRVRRIVANRTVPRRNAAARVLAAGLAVAVLLTLVGQSVSSWATAEREGRWAESRSLGEAVYAVLGVTAPNPTLCDDILAAARAFARTRDTSDPAVSALVDSLNRGGRPDAVLESLLPSLRLDSDRQPFGAAVGPLTLLWVDLPKSMLGHAATATDPAEARRWARAALLLSAQDLPGTFAGGARVMLQEPSLHELAGISAGDRRLLLRANAYAAGQVDDCMRAEGTTVARGAPPADLSKFVAAVRVRPGYAWWLAAQAAGDDPPFDRDRVRAVLDRARAASPKSGTPAAYLAALVERLDDPASQGIRPVQLDAVDLATPPGRPKVIMTGLPAGPATQPAGN
jgi:beta-lactamase regulating signal transducer with metallopeptidase domain